MAKRKKAEPAEKPPPSEGGLYSVEILAQLFNRTPRRIQQLAREGVLPKPVGRKGYPLGPTVRAFVAYLDGLAKDEDLARKALDHRVRLAAAKADVAELERDQLLGRLAPVDRLSTTWASIVTTTKSRLRAVPGQARTRLPHLSPRDLEVVGILIDEALADLASGHAMTPAQEDADE